MTDNRPEADRILVARLHGEAKHHAHWRGLTGDQEAAAVAALRELDRYRHVSVKPPGQVLAALPEARGPYPPAGDTAGRSTCHPPRRSLTAPGEVVPLHRAELAADWAS